MADRAIVSEVVQVGIEATSGTAVAVSKKFQGMSVALDTALAVDQFGPMGQIVDSIVAPRQEWATGRISGYPTYTELMYALANLLGAATISPVTGVDTGTKQWLWSPSASTPWTPRTWTIQRGIPGDTAEQATYGIMSGLTLGFSRTAAPSLAGDLFAQRLDYSATVTATGVTTLPLVPILAPEIDVYLDTASGSIGTTRLTRDFDVEFHLTGLFNPIWPLNSANNSFAAHVMAKPDVGAKIRVGNDAAGRALVPYMRAGSTVFLRVKCTSQSFIVSATPYSLTIDLAAKVMAAPSRGDITGLSTLEWTLRVVNDAGWGNWLVVTGINNIAALT